MRAQSILELKASLVVYCSKWILLNEEVLGLSVKERMDYMLGTIEEMGGEGIEMRELVKTFYDKWGYRLTTIKLSLIHI